MDEPESLNCKTCIYLGEFYRAANTVPFENPENVFKRCNENSINKHCHLDNWPPIGGATPTCERFYNLSCGPNATLYTNNECTTPFDMSGGVYWYATGVTPPDESCGRTFQHAQPGPNAPGVDCEDEDWRII